MKVWMGSVAALAFAVALAVPAARADPEVSLEFAPAGTRLSWHIVQNGSTIERTNTVLGKEGPWASYVRGSETTPQLFVAPGCWACSKTTFDQAAYLRLWPLLVGNSVTLERRSPTNPAKRWKSVISVLRIESVTTPAGQFETVVLQDKSTAEHSAWQGVLTEWWSADLGWIVRKTESDSEGRDYSAELAAIERP